MWEKDKISLNGRCGKKIKFTINIKQITWDITKKCQSIQNNANYKEGGKIKGFQWGQTLLKGYIYLGDKKCECS